MSNTNLTDGSQLYCFSLNCKRNYLENGEKPGDATKTGENGELSVVKGVSPMDIQTTDITIDKNGKIADGTKNIDKKLDEKADRMEKFNKAIEKEQKANAKSRRKRPSGNEHESR